MNWNIRVFKQKIEKELILILVLAIAIRLFLLLTDRVNFVDSDEAIVGLMGKHILEGKEFPIFFYGNKAYMGSLEAFLAAASFLFFGVSTFTLKLVPFILSLLFIVVTFFLAREIMGREGAILSSLLLAIPPAFFAIWSLKARGGYIETLLFGSLILLLTYRYLREDSPPKSNILILSSLGFIWGLAYWTNPLIIYYLIISLFFLFIKEKRGIFFHLGLFLPPSKVENNRFWHASIRFLSILIAAYYVLIIAILITKGFSLTVAGITIRAHHLRNPLLTLLSLWSLRLLCLKRIGYSFSELLPAKFLILLFSIILGGLPFWIYQVNNAFESFSSGTLTETGNIFSYFKNFLFIGLPVILGVRRPWYLTDFISYLSVSTYFLYLLIFGYVVYKRRSGLFACLKLSLDKVKDIDSLILLLFLIPIIFSISQYGWFAVEPRYLLPLYSTIPILIAAALLDIKRVSRKVYVGLVALILGTNLFGSIMVRDVVQGERDNSSLIQFLTKEDIRTAFATYWLAYRLTFETNEEIICTPREPWDDRYPEYTRMVRENKESAYIFTNWEDNRANEFERLLRKGQVNYSVRTLGEYKLFYSFAYLPDKGQKGPLPPHQWKAYSIYGEGALLNTFDKDISTRWTTGLPQNPGMYYQIDLGQIYTLERVVLALDWNDIEDYPRGVTLEVSIDGRSWKRIIADRRINKDSLGFIPFSLPYFNIGVVLSFPSVEARHLKFIQTGSDKLSWWSINEIMILGSRGRQG